MTLSLPAARVLAPFRRALVVFGLALLTGAAGMVFVFFAMYRQRARLRELARAESFRAAFVADVSHEIKTPLAGILGCVDLLSEGEAALSTEARAKLFAGLKDESRRLNALAQDIVSLSRIDAAAREGSCAQDTLDLAELARETVDRSAPEAEAAGVALACEVSGPRPATGDAELLGRALSNLVRNAIRHSGSPRVTVRVGKEGVAVEDAGIGIPHGHREKIFERFHRVDPSRSDRTGGSGLGLAIARGVARLHGGDVIYEPVSPHGSRFTIRLPPSAEKAG